MRLSYLLAHILLFALAARVYAPRSLAQSCPIWKCASGCALEDQLSGGVRRWVCAACQPTYRLIWNKRACACPAGTFESLSGNNCTRCPQGSYCPAGNGNGASGAQNVGTSLPFAPLDDSVTSGMRSYRFSCGLNMTTRLQGAKEEISCVTQAGYFYTGPGQNANQCPLNSYSPGLNRLPACYVCPSGLITTSIGRASKTECLVPGGSIMNRGVVTPCPKGTYREGNSPPTTQLQCIRCKRGWTTVGVESFLETHCNVTLPGFESTVGTQAGGPATACPQGTFSVERPGGTPCTPCPDGYTTRDIGTDSDNLPIGYTSSSACNAPPGYYADGNGVQKCPNGTYAGGWARRLYVQSCTSCGTNIFSEQRTEDDYEYGFVSAQPQDCYIPAGWGMTFNRGTGLFTATLCPKDTYGSSEITYGLMFTPCKPCARGLLTTGPGSTSDSDCLNPPGYGWDGFTANVCPAGFYSAAGALSRCTACPMYRNTTSSTPPFNDPVEALPLPAGTGLDQDDITDCKVIAGYGVTGNTAPLSSLTDQQKVALDVQECEQGTYSIGGALDSECIACSGGAAGTLGPSSTTRGTGSIGPSDCSVCLAGFGTLANSFSALATSCTGCNDGYYNAGDSTTCATCGSNALFIYPGKEDPVTFRPTSRSGTSSTPGARTTDECYPLSVQLDESMGTHIVDTSVFLASGGSPPGASVGTASTAQACANSCTGGCLAAIFVYSTTTTDNADDRSGRCLLVNSGGSAPLYVKVLPLDYVSGASKSKKISGQAAVASGHFVLWSGANPSLLGLPLSTFPGSVENCRATCNNDRQCWGFFYSGGSCMLRRGYEAEGHRTFLRTVTTQLA